MKYQILDLVASGRTQDWSYTGEPSAWQACLRGSGDTSYIYSSTLNDTCQLVVPPGSAPVQGFVSGITLHYRIQGTGELRFPTVTPTLFYDGSTLVLADYPAANVWSDEVRKSIGYNDGTAHRFSGTDLSDLTIQFEVTVAPATGEFQISEVWLVVEYCDTPEFYDPVTTTATPDAVPGYLAWNTVGAEAQAIVGDILYVEDVSNVDFRNYWRALAAYRYPMATEISLDVLASGFAVVTPDKTCVLRLAKVDDGARSVWLTLVQDQTFTGDYLWYLGLVGEGLDANDLAAYLATHELTAAEIVAMNYVTLTVGRNEDPDAPGVVEVALNHTTVMTALYRDFPTTTVQRLGFGTGEVGDAAAQSMGMLLNFWSWRHYQTAGGRFRGWDQDVGGTNTVEVNSTDYAIVKPQAAPGPYLGTQVGQSPYCCELVARDPTALCSVCQLYLPLDPGNAYNIFVDYRVTTFGQAAEILVQHTSNFWYWDQGLNDWAAGEISSTLPAAMTRQYGYAVMTNVRTGVTGSSLLIRVRCIGGAPAHSVMIYKVLLVAA